MRIVTDFSITSAPMRARRGWHPGWLFRGSAEGIWLDTADHACLFQDAAGATPVTAPGQTVGLILDKSLGLARGANIGSPADATLIEAPDKASHDAQEDCYQIERDASGGGEVRFDVPADRFVEIDLEVLPDGGGSAVGLRDGSTVLASVGPSHGRTTRILRFPSGTLRINLTSFPLATRFRIHTIRTVAGNHAMQPVTARRPVYQTDGARHWLAFDGIDDFLRFDLGFSADEGFFMAYAGAVTGNGRIINRSSSNSDTWTVASGRWTALFTTTSLDAAGFGFDLTAPHVGAYHATEAQAALLMNGAVGPVDATQGKPVTLNDMAFGARTDGVAAFEGSLSGLIICRGGLAPQEAASALHHLTENTGVPS